MDFVADTTFLVGLWRRQPWAMAFARKEAVAVNRPLVTRNRRHFDLISGLRIEALTGD